MALSRGFTLFESLVTLLVLATLIAMAGIFWSWGDGGAKEQAYVRAIEDLLSRTKHSAEVLEHSVAICFSLSESCMAEGVLIPRDVPSAAEGVQRWQLLEGLPLKGGIFIRTNFNEQQLIVQAGGQSVRQPGTIHICSMNRKLPYAWSIVVARSGRVTTKTIEGQDFANICRASD